MLIRRRNLCLTLNYSRISLQNNEDKRKKLQEIPATRLQQFTIKFVLFL